MLNKIIEFFTKRRMSEVERYLAGSSDLCHLESRLKKLNNKGLIGWVH